MSISFHATKAEADAVGGETSWTLAKNGKPWRAATGDDISIDPRPTVSKWQLIQACADAGITEAQIDAAVATLTAKRQRFWKYTNVIDRDNPMSSGLRAALPGPPTGPRWNAIFLAASQLDPLIV